MRKLLIAVAWAFVIGVAAYDVHFAWQYREGFDIWEMNPLARWLARDWGLQAVFGIKSVGMGFAVGVAAYCHRCQHRLEIPYTLVTSGVHLLLSLHYLFGW